MGSTGLNSESSVLTSVLAAAILMVSVSGFQFQIPCPIIDICLVPCLPYITDYSSDVPSLCCSVVDDMLKKNVRCICDVMKDNGKLFGILPYNTTRLMTLPGTCKLDAQPIVNNCFM